MYYTVHCSLKGAIIIEVAMIPYISNKHPGICFISNLIDIAVSLLKRVLGIRLDKAVSR